MEKTKISGINFSEKTIENVEVSGNDVKEFKFEFNDNTFKITVMKNNDEVVEEVFEEQKVEEVVEHEVVEQEVLEEPASKKLSIEEVKQIIYENIPKKTLEIRISELLSKYMKILRKMTFINSCTEKMKLLNLLKRNTTNSQLLKTNFVVC